jgi:hypothetical protein
MPKWPQTLGLSLTALIAASGTLVCCVLPAIMVALGAGATLASLVVAVPQLVWLSQHKVLVFGSAGILLLVAGFAVWNARRAPCPMDPALAAHCKRLRGASLVAYSAAAGLFLMGTLFAFVLPLFGWL